MNSLLPVTLASQGFIEPSATPLRTLVQEDMAKVDALISYIGESRVQLILDMSHHIIASGGKRLRPALTLATARLCNYQGDRHIDLAAAVELMHTATLLHDDVVDESNLRRGEATANSVWDNKSSVLVGDFLLGQAFQLMVRSDSLRVLAILSHAASVIAEGEVKQLVATNNLDVTKETYIDIIASKTAKLFSAACEISPVMALRPETECKALADFGMYLGIAFQIVDDILDYSAKQEELGKTIGDDFREGKITLPIIIAYQRGNAEEKSFWERVVGEHDQQEGDLAQAISLIQKSNALTLSLEEARHYMQLGSEALAIFSDSEAKTALLEILEFSVYRAY